jgi:hypothetical protein
MQLSLRHWCFHFLLSTIAKCLQVKIGKYSRIRHTRTDPSQTFVAFLLQGYCTGIYLIECIGGRDRLDLSLIGGDVVDPYSH